MFQPRFYRNWIGNDDLCHFNVVVKETDLYIRAQRNLKRKALKAILKYRAPLERYIEQHPDFLTTFKPILVDDEAPYIVKVMAEAAEKSGVGPMAGVAGAIAECVGKELLPFSPEIIIENCGDIFLKILKRRSVGIYAGLSPLSGKIALEIKPEETPLGISTSSGTVGHSFSSGKADGVTVLAPSAALADAAATAIGNRVINNEDIPQAIKFAQEIDGLKGVLIIKGKQLGIWGKVKFAPSALYF
jgi:hypothetical protein